MSGSMDSVDKMHPSTVFPLNKGWQYKHISSIAFTYHKKGGEGNGQELPAGSSEGIFSWCWKKARWRNFRRDEGGRREWKGGFYELSLQVMCPFIVFEKHNQGA